MQNYINKEKSNIIKHAHKKKYEIHKNYFDYNFSLNYIPLQYVIFQGLHHQCSHDSIYKQIIISQF